VYSPAFPLPYTAFSAITGAATFDRWLACSLRLLSEPCCACRISGYSQAIGLSLAARSPTMAEISFSNDKAVLEATESLYGMVSCKMIRDAVAREWEALRNRVSGLVRKPVEKQRGREPRSAHERARYWDDGSGLIDG
jgi:hypothetical protein